jgi:hypothetical protein
LVLYVFHVFHTSLRGPLEVSHYSEPSFCSSPLYSCLTSIILCRHSESLVCSMYGYGVCCGCTC